MTPTKVSTFGWLSNLFLMTCMSIVFFAVIRQRRQKRSISSPNNITYFKSCLKSEDRDMFEYVIKGGCVSDESYDLRCKMRRDLRSCFYYVTCLRLSQRYYWNCTTAHRGSSNPFCCDVVCQEKPTTEGPTAL